MVDRNEMKSLLEGMEQAAEETLHQSATFHEAVEALKFEIDHDPRVRATVGELRAAGRSVFNSFVPHIKIRVRTEEGIFSLPQRPKIVPPPPSDPIGRLTQQLKNAATLVIKNSHYFQELENIVNEAVAGSEAFEHIALEVEGAGHEVLICLDLSAYVEVRAAASAAPPQIRTVVEAQPVVPVCFNGNDIRFLRDLGIQI